MDSALYKIEAVPDGPKLSRLYLNREQAKLLGLINNSKVVAQIGFTKLNLRVVEQENSSSGNTLYLSEAAYAELDWYQGQPLWLAFSSKKTFLLGPTLGITVSMPTWKKIAKVWAIEKRALLALEKGIVFCCFHLSKVDCQNNLIEAYTLNPNNYCWEQKYLPFPQVLYHRATFPFEDYAEEKGSVYYKIWANPKILPINSTYYFDKWKVYQALATYRNTENYQPETTWLTLEALNKFLSKYPFCFVKGNYGRCGRQVIRIEKKGSSFVCKTGGSNVTRWNFSTVESLNNFLLDKLGEESILQQGINLARINNRPFDIRVLVQKNFASEWTISALSFRIADPKAVVTNIAAGAEEISVAPEDNIYPKLSMEELHKFCVNTLHALEATYGALGEVGLDIGLDQDDKLWLIEANGQPSSRGYREAASEEVCNQIFGLPLDYAKALIRSNLHSYLDNSFSQD